MIKTLKTLCEARGVAGDESEVASLIKKLAEPHCDSIETDTLGNVICFKKGKSSKKTVMADAHMDEVGLYIKSVTEDGMFKFEAIGIDPRVLNGRTVLIGEKKVVGVIGTKAIHLQSPAERETAPTADKLYIDIGASKKEVALKVASEGDTVIFNSDFRKFGDGFIKSKALDNRAGCAILLEAMKEKPAYDTYYVFSVLEEKGGFGARAATVKIKPDLALVIDTTTSADFLPEEDDIKSRATILGEGVVVFYMESSTIYAPKSIEKIIKIAQDNKIKYQYKTVTAGGLNSGSIQRTVGGVETMAIATPCRYLHSGSSVVNNDDLNSTLKLTKALLTSDKII